MGHAYSNLLFHAVSGTKGRLPVLGSELNQEKHPVRLSFREEPKALLDRNDISYDPRYVGAWAHLSPPGGGSGGRGQASVPTASACLRAGTPWAKMCRPLCGLLGWSSGPSPRSADPDRRRSACRAGIEQVFWLGSRPVPMLPNVEIPGKGKPFRTPGGTGASCPGKHRSTKPINPRSRLQSETEPSLPPARTGSVPREQPRSTDRRTAEFCGSSNGNEMPVKRDKEWVQQGTARGRENIRMAETDGDRSATSLAASNPVPAPAA
jgi:hypothetical protein